MKIPSDWLWKVWCKQLSLAGTARKRSGDTQIVFLFLFCYAADWRLQGGRDEGQTSQWPHAEGLASGGSPSKQLFLSPSMELLTSPLPFLLPHSLGCVWYAAHACRILCAFPSCRMDRPTWTLSVALFCCAGWSHWAAAPAFPSCRGSGPGLQCRMGDNLLIAGGPAPAAR